VYPYITSKVLDSLLISRATLWCGKGDLGPHDILLENGRVSAISKAPILSKSPSRVFNAEGLVVLPAGVDPQVHLRVPGQAHKETAESGLWAAVHGGVGALLTMPNTKPVIDDRRIYELAVNELKHAEAVTGVKVLLSAAITKGQQGREVVDFDALSHAGVAAFTDDGVGVASDSLMLEALRASARTQRPILQHAEVPGHGAVLAPGPTQVTVGGPAYLEDAEVEMVARDIRLLAEVPDAIYHVLHVSSKKTLELVHKARSKGLKISCEASPHHLFFTADDIQANNSSFKMNPPLRSRDDRAALQEALKDGRCQFVATDHAPHENEIKSTNFKTSAFGTTGLETSLKVLLWLLNNKKLTVSRLVEVWADEPAKFLNIFDRFGSFAVGKDFNGVIIDAFAPDALVSGSSFIGKSKNSCFIGSHLPGRIVATVLGKNLHEISQ
jgi:dihydroorotase